MTLRDYINDNGLARYINNSRAGKIFENSVFARTIEYAIEHSGTFIENMRPAVDPSHIYYHPPMPRQKAYADTADNKKRFDIKAFLQGVGSAFNISGADYLQEEKLPR
ncbi:MAG: hypothetical protein AABX05_02310, partial [Nanoarchaeota archaeon]